MSYRDAYRRSIDEPEAFWGAAASALDWHKPPQQLLDSSTPPFSRWFVGGEINSCHNLLDRHVDGGRAEQPALIYESPITGAPTRIYSYRQLRDEVACFASVLRAQGVGRGDRVILYMPMVPEAVIGMLACARLGAIHSVVFGGFAPHELATRIDDAQPKALWNADERFVEAYLNEHPGHYKTGDAAYIDDDGYVFVMSRIDDVINVAGHRLSTGAMEEVLAAHPDVAECAVIGAYDELKGQLPVGFLVLKAGVDRPAADLVAEVIQLVRDRIGAIAAFKQAVVVRRLPKTRSGKILRGTMVKIADGQDYAIPATIDDPAIPDDITAALQRIGYPHPAAS